MAILDQTKENALFDANQVYSHGLEQIYALENVDIRTVRPLAKPIAKEEKKERPQWAPEEPDQGELDLGDFYRGWMPSIKLQEPIKVLKLSPVAAKVLEQHGIHLLNDLYKKKPGDLVYIKGLGQGHIDEIEKKMSEYLGEGQLERSRSVDFVGLLRAFLSELRPKEAALVLQPHRLSHLFKLTAAEEAEMRHLSNEQKEDLRTQICENLKRRDSFLSEQLESVIAVFVKPWIVGRLGLATHEELLERLERVSTYPEETKAILAYFSRRFSLGRYLEEPAKGFYAVGVAEQYQEVVSLAQSYFYQKEIIYPLEELVTLLEREFARLWQGHQEGFVRKVLRFAPDFMIFRFEKQLRCTLYRS